TERRDQRARDDPAARRRPPEERRGQRHRDAVRKTKWCGGWCASSATASLAAELCEPLAASLLGAEQQSAHDRRSRAELAQEPSPEGRDEDLGRSAVNRLEDRLGDDG